MEPALAKSATGCSPRWVSPVEGEEAAAGHSWIQHPKEGVAGLMPSAHDPFPLVPKRCRYGCRALSPKLITERHRCSQLAPSRECGAIDGLHWASLAPRFGAARKGCPHCQPTFGHVPCFTPRPRAAPPAPQHRAQALRGGDFPSQATPGGDPTLPATFPKCQETPCSSLRLEHHIWRTAGAGGGAQAAGARVGWSPAGAEGLKLAARPGRGGLPLAQRAV